MKSLLLTLTLTLVMAGTIAQADGFVCSTESGLTVKVYNHTDANQGTRTGSIMIVSDSSIGQGNKTIASFSDVKSTLTSSQLDFQGKVDLRVSESKNKGELIAGTKLGQLSTIDLVVDFTYAQPLENGAELTGVLLLQKRNGDVIEDAANCVRYLKN